MNSGGIDRPVFPPTGWLTSRRAVIATALALTLAGALPRLINLGELSFYADEETTALAARSLAAGEGSTMPTGLSYRRALPLTWLNAASAKLFGTEREISYRIPTAILGALTVPLLFLFGLRYVGGPAALVAALLLAFSEWHLVFSRQARMYAGFVFFFVAATFAIWAWTERGKVRDLLLAIVLSVAATSLHSLGLLLAAIAVIPLAFDGWARSSRIAILAFAVGVAIAANVLQDFAMVSATVPLPPPESVAGRAPSREWLPESITSLPGWAFLLALLGAALGLWAAQRSEPSDPATGGHLRKLGSYLAAALAGAAACAGQLHAAALALLVFLLFHPAERRSLLRRAWLPAAVVAAIAFLWAAATVMRLGPVDGAKALIAYPFPFIASLTLQFPSVMLLFLGTCVWLALRRPLAEEYALRGCAIAALLLIAAVGSRRGWSLRFLLGAYPFLLLAASAGLILALSGLRRLSRRWDVRLATGTATIVAVSGILAGHGLPQALHMVNLRHGEEVNLGLHMYAFRPDHKGAGEFVRAQLAAGDVVIAEDPIEQHWYAGRADYWLRSFTDSRIYLNRAPDGQLHDIYVNSALLREESALDSLVGQSMGRVWLVTSGETFRNRSYYLDPWQRVWLDSLEQSRAPAFEGRDGATRVFCLNCPVVTESPRPPDL